MSRLSNLLFLIFFLGACLVPPVGNAAQAASVTCHFYDRDGNLLSSDQVRSVMGGPRGWSTSALIHPVSLQNLKEEPLFPSGKGLAFALLSTPAALILDNGGV